MSCLSDGIKDVSAFFSGVFTSDETNEIIQGMEDLVPDDSVLESIPNIPMEEEVQEEELIEESTPPEEVETEEEVVVEDTPIQNPTDTLSTAAPTDTLPCDKEFIKGYFATKKTIKVPVSGGAKTASVNYTVKKGDTLSKIAGKYSGVSYTDIATENNISAPKYSISVGKVLRIPKQVATKDKVIYEKITKASLGKKVYLVVETKGYKNGGKVKIAIYEKEKMLVKTNTKLPFLKAKTQQTEVMATVKIDTEDGSQKAIVEIELRPKIDKKEDDKSGLGSLEEWKEKFKKENEDDDERKDHLWLKVSDTDGMVEEKEFLKGGELEVDITTGCGLTEDLLKQIFPNSKASRRKEVQIAFNKYCHEYKINTLDRVAHFLGQIGTETAELKKLKESYNYSEKAIYNTFLKVLVNHPTMVGEKTYKYHDLIEGYDADLSDCQNGYMKGIKEPIVITPLSGIYKTKKARQLAEYAAFKKLYSIKSEYIKSKTLFDYVYGCRMENGKKSTKDGSDYFGVGFIHMTGKSKYKTLHKIWNQKYPNDKKDFLGDDISLLKTDIDVAMKAAMIIWEYQKLNTVAIDKSKVKAVSYIVNGGYNGLSDRKKYTKKAYEVLEKVLK